METLPPEAREVDPGRPPKRLVFCFDGTWDRLDAKYPTNVVITAESVIPIADDGASQLIYYDEGVGTEKGRKYRDGIFGTGLVRNLGDAYRFLIFNHTPGDQIYVFGFSRGAYTARSFVGFLSNCAILRRRDAARVTEAIKLYESRTGDSRLSEAMCRFRSEVSPDVCVSIEEDEWRVRNIGGYAAGSSPLLKVRYLGVWDTVGSLGVPRRYRLLNFLNKLYQFHDTMLTDFVESARHAVAIDEHRVDFQPSLWDKLTELNAARGANEDDDDAPYQQKWFPGTHGSVGGGGDRRGLSDQCLDWVLDGARHAGLQLDNQPSSRIFELAPNYAEYLVNETPPEKTGLLTRAMGLLPTADRTPGPGSLFEVSISARRRWLDLPENLRDAASYRPKTLARVAPALDALDPAEYGVGAGVHPVPDGSFRLHDVRRGDELRKLAQLYYGDPNKSKLIAAANLDKVIDPNRIYVGMRLRIPCPHATTAGFGDRS